MKVILKLSSLIALGLLAVFSPIISRSNQRSAPSVKAAFTSTPTFPKSQNLTTPEITAQGVFIIDLDSGLVLYNKNSSQRLKPASLTKIMTSIVAMDQFQDDSIIKVNNGSASIGNTAELIIGDELNALDVFYALLVPSGNDAAVTLAENYPGGYQNFVAQMNQKVIELGLKDTHFTNVSGVESADHYTSAHDITIITKYALRRHRFASIVSTSNYGFTSLKGRHYTFNSTNVLLKDSDIRGVKTGWTPEAGECLVILAELDRHKVIVSLLNSQDRFGEARQLVDWVRNNYVWE